MKKQFWFTLIFSLILTACSTAEVNEETLQPINNTDWPTPQPTLNAPIPTPFPKISLADLGLPTPTPLANSASPVETTSLAAAESKTDAPQATVAVANSETKTGDNEVQEQDSDQATANYWTSTSTKTVNVISTSDDLLTASRSYALSPISVARVAHLGTAVRPGSSFNDAPIDTLLDDQEAISVLAVDRTRQWVLVQPAHSRVGWVALADLTGDDNLVAAPLAVTAWVASNGLILHNGPGIYAGEIGPIPTNSLMLVLGLNEGRSWALVTPVLGGGQGWLPLQFITPSIPAAELPIVKGEGGVSGMEAESELSMVNSQLLAVNDQPHLVFQLASGGDIMVINPDGSNLRRLTSGIDPALSPDGQTIAFTRWVGESGSLWTINLDGTNERQLLEFTKQAKAPAWSPDGQQIVVNFQYGGRLNSKTECADVLKNPNPAIPWNADVSTDKDGDPKIKIQVDKDHNIEAMLCWKLPPDPHWSLRVVNVADGKFEDLDGGVYAFHPTWDPTQPWRIISDGGMGLVEADVNQKTSHRLTDQIGDSSPAFSANGRYLAVTIDQNGGTDIYRLNADGSGRIRLTKTPLWVTAMPNKPKPWHNVSPTWSPDGSQIAFLTDRAGRWEIWVMNADGHNLHPLFATAINDRLQLSYNFVDERVLSWQ